MKPAFETAITVLGFGWNPINNEAAWNLPGMRWSKEHAVKYCATTGSMVNKDVLHSNPELTLHQCWHILVCQKTGLFRPFQMDFREYLSVYTTLLKLFTEMFAYNQAFADRLMVVMRIRDSSLPNFPPSK